MKECDVPVLRSKTVTNFEDAKRAAEELLYPVIIRVAYTLGGRVAELPIMKLNFTKL